jgi:methyl-accepting chemotaxis protein
MKRWAPRSSRSKKALDSFEEASDAERKLFAEVQRVESLYGPVALNIVAMALADNREEATDKMNAECRPLLAALIAATNAYVEHAAKVAAQEVVDAKAAYVQKRNGLLGACALALCMAIALSVFITRGLIRALGAEPAELSAAVGRVADGDLSQPLILKAGDEVSVLASVARMQAALNSVVSTVRAGSDNVATASAQISQGNSDLSQRTEQQASSLEETAASMEELGSTVRQNADNAKQANQLALGASDVAEKGGTVVNQVVSTMKEINESSRRIVDIIGVIDGIAFQTNILALNAAVEAARAGDQGRGFAVVASEVRVLAQRSAEAAKQIKSLISASVERVDQGTELVDQAGATMAEVVVAIKRVTDIMGEISSASVEQSAGVAQVGEAVTHMDRATQQNAALVEESAAGAEALRMQAEQLVKAVAVFKLAGTEARPAAAPAPAQDAAAARRPEAANKQSTAKPLQPAARKPIKSKGLAPAALGAMAGASMASESWESF